MPINIDPTWHAFFKREGQKQYLRDLADKVKQEYASKTCYPPYNKIFNAFLLTPRDQVKVVIIGQDPYHNDGQAQGLSFSVPNGMKLPPSLVNIGKELEAEFGCPCINPNNGDLSDWAKQGVLLLNTSLTVQAHNAGSHASLGWMEFTDEVIRELDADDRPIVFILWGAHAQKKKELLVNPNHLVLMSAHPSPFSAHKGFFGNGHFKKANDWLESQGESSIDWNITKN